MTVFILFLQTAVRMGTQILFATLGGIMSEKVGNTQLGIEGMMLLGATAGFSAGLATGNPLAAVFAAGLAGLAGAAIYAFITVSLRGNQVVTGLILTIFGGGVAGYMGKFLGGASLPESFHETFRAVKVPLLSKIPLLCTVFFEQGIFELSGIVAALVLFCYFQFTRMGLAARVVGENPAVADASGINVTLYKYIHILIGGFFCGLGGGYLSVVFVPRWQTNVTAGAGWIAVALIIFSNWNPLKAIFAAYLFGALRGAGYYFQNVNFLLFGHKFYLSPQLLDMAPYLATIIVLVISTARNSRETAAPAGLGVAWFREER